MTALRELQRDFLAALQGATPRGLRHLASDRRLPQVVGLGIYAHAYRARLREALENDHALLGQYLGDALWEQMCDGYITAHPSRYRSLRQFGDRLPEYLMLVAPFADHPQIADLAAFERLLLDSFDAADSERVEWSTLETLPSADWPNLRLRFHPSLQRYRSRTNAVEIWQALKNADTPPEPQTGLPAEWVLWRDNERITRFRSLEDNESAALDHFLQGGDFAGQCELLLEWFDPQVVPSRALQLLQRWIEDGWVAHSTGVQGVRLATALGAE